MKRMFLLLLTIFYLPAAQMPPKAPMASLEGLPTELKQLIVMHTGINGGVLNIPALALGLTTLAATSKSLHAAINNPKNMLTFLKLLPRAGAKLLAERLKSKEKTIPGIQSKLVQDWLNKINLEQGEELIEAIRAEPTDIATINSILKNPNINVNWKPAADERALFIALEQGKRIPKEIIKLILNAGADINAKNRYGHTPLMFASSFGGAPEEILKMLIEVGSNINAITPSGNTSLMLASQAGQATKVKILLDAGADISIQNKNGKSALQLARDEAQQYPHEKRLIATIQLLEEAEKTQKEKAARK